jgi:TusA-related sulfurtransferase
MAGSRTATRARSASSCWRYGDGVVLDVTDVTCPLTWVRTKLALERMAPGEELVVVVNPGEALENVPRSAAEAGHEVSVEGTRVRIVRR